MVKAHKFHNISVKQDGCRKVCSFVTDRNSSCGKVMFLHPSVSHSVHRVEGVCTSPLDRHPLADTLPPRQTPPQADTSATPPPPETATAADGTHPTRMHSCLGYFIRFLSFHCQFMCYLIFTVRVF